jgi:cell division septal protein FtsQ
MPGQVEGAPPPVAAKVRAALGPLQGKSLLVLGGAAVQQALAGIPQISAVQYDRDFPHTLRVVVRPEIPVAVARRGAEAWLVAADARVLSPLPLGAYRSLPRIWLTASAEPEVGTLLTDRLALRAVRALALAHRAHFDGRIRFVRAREHELTVVLGSGLELRLGELRAVRLKLAVASVIVPKLVESGGYSYLDVSVPKRPVASKNSQPEG